MGERICSEPDCKSRSRGWCNAHYLAARKRGDFVPAARETKAPRLAGPDERKCSHPDCPRRYFSRDLCNLHYGQAYRNGVLPPRQLELPFNRHSLSRIDREAATADCSICGPGVRVRVRVRRYPQCWTLYVNRPRKPWSRANGRRRTPEQRRAMTLRQEYGLTVAAFAQMEVAQGGACAICGETPSKRLHVDHCHETGRVRGLLCQACNVGLGFFRDDPGRLTRAVGYLGAA